MTGGIRRGTWRPLTDLVGPEFSTLVPGSTYSSVTEFEQSTRATIGNRMAGVLPSDHLALRSWPSRRS
jgi:hypothetical protein